MKKYVLSLIIVFISYSYALSQNYQTGIGLRGGFSNGVTIKHFIGGDKAIEGILSTRWRGFLITGLLEFHRPTNAEGLVWYFGFGGHLGYWNNNNNKNPWRGDNDVTTIIGADGILGIEYTFSEVPFNLSLDWKPAFNIIGHSGFWGDGGAFSIRYVF